MNGLKKVRRASVAKVSHIGTTAMLALIVGAHAKAQVTSADIVDGQVKTPDLASSAVTSAKIAGSAVTRGKIAGNAVTSAKVQDNSLTGADINESTLSGVDAETLNGISRQDMLRLGLAVGAGTFDLPDCSPGLDYLVRQITVPWAGSVLVNALFTAQSGIVGTGSYALAARVELTSPVFVAGTWGESHVAYNSPNQRTNISTTDVFNVSAGTNTFVLKVCDYSDVNQGAVTIRGQMTFVYSPNPRL